MLNFDYEMRAVPEAFDGIPELMIQKEVQQYIDHIQVTFRRVSHPYFCLNAR